MSKKDLTFGKRNFTKISDSSLIIGQDYLPIIKNLLFYKVLKTSELAKLSGYDHGVKSFRKILARFKRQKLVSSGPMFVD